MHLRPITVITMFLQEISVALDNGKRLGLQDVETHIEAGDLIPWLKKELATVQGVNLDNCGRNEEAEWLQEQYAAYLGGYRGDERRKWGIEHNGLCLLISWGTEIIRNLFGRER